MPFLDAVLPIIYFHGIQIIFTSFSHLVWGLPNDFIAMGFHSYTFFYELFRLAFYAHAQANLTFVI
jgi:hypothetical protein